MRITKFSHCCLLIEERGVRILTDPGMFGTAQDAVSGIDIVLITHEHADHFHVPSLRKVLANNPKASVITNHSVGKLLDAERIPYRAVSDGGGLTYRDVSIEGFGRDHAVIYQKFALVENTGYLISQKLFYPGDAFYDPHRAIDVLALPIAGPWMKISEALDYARAVKPNKCFPVHDGMMRSDIPNFAHRVAGQILGPEGISFVPMGDGAMAEF